MDKKIIRMPISGEERNRNLYGAGYIPCQVSDRWLQFEDKYNPESGCVLVGVMTLDSNDNPKKICDLCLNISDIKSVIQKIKPM